MILLGGSREDSTSVESESREEEVEGCIASAMKGRNPRVKVVPAKEFRRALFPGGKFEDTPRSVEDLLSGLQDAGWRQRVEALGIRYLVVVDSVTSRSDRRPEFDFNQGLWAIGESWTRSSSMSASVIDARRVADAGDVSSRSHGREGYVIPVVLVFPLFPFPWFARTEAECCSSLGAAVSGFLAEERSDAAEDSRPAAEERRPAAEEPRLARSKVDHKASFELLPQWDTLSYSDDHYRPCFTCHDKGMVDPGRRETGFRDGTKNLHAGHVNRDEGKSCKACHLVGPNGNLFFGFYRTKIPFGDSWTLPLPEGTIAEGGSCQTRCHDSRSYNRSAPVPGSK